MESDLRSLVKIDLIEKMVDVDVKMEEGFSIHRDGTIGVTIITSLGVEVDYFISIPEYFDACCMMLLKELNG